MTQTASHTSESNEPRPCHDLDNSRSFSDDVAHGLGSSCTLEPVLEERQRSLRIREENTDLNENERRAGQEILVSAPVTVIIPTGSKCNLQCVFCTDRSADSHYSYKNLSFQTFLQFSEVLYRAKSVGLYGWGEPLVNPEYAAIVDYVTREFFGVELYVTTNGVLLNERWVRRFIEYPWTRLTISINAATSDTYLSIMRCDKFSHVVGNVKRLLEMRREAHTESPSVALSFVTMTSNVSELSLFVRLASKLGADSVVIQDLKVLEDGQENLSLIHDVDLAKRCHAAAESEARQRGIPLSTFQPISYFDGNTVLDCFDPWESFRVSENGDVFPCCYSNTAMGNVLQQGVEEIWNGDLFRLYRRTVNTQRPPRECLSCAKKVGAASAASHKWRRS